MPRRLPSRAAARRLVRGHGAATLALALAASSCATSRSDINLAPLYARTTGADGVTEHESVGGMVRAERDPTTGDLRSFEVRPLFGWRRGWADPARAPRPHKDWEPPRRGDWRVDFIAPLGNVRQRGERFSSLLFPAYYYQSNAIEGTDARRRDLYTLPFIVWSANETGTTQFAIFPLYGDLDRFITYENVRFFLFPFYASASRQDFTHHHVLFPIFGWTANHPVEGSEAPPRKQFRVWPLFGYHVKPGHWARYFFLWPIFSLQREELWKENADERLTAWMVWPLFGWTRRGTYRSASVLWPFFGLAWDPRGGELDPGRGPEEGPDPDDSPREQLLTEPANPGGPYWAWDGPWPLVRIQRGGRSPAAEERTRVWPLFSHFRGDGVWWDTYAWPVVQRRHEIGPDYERASFYVIPFYQSFTLERTRPDGPADLPDEYLRGDRVRWNKIWPLIKSEEIDEWRRDALLALTPTTRWDIFDHYYAWIWEIWALERNGERKSGRSWLGLYSYESDGDEERHSLTGLWSRRSWGEDERRVRETSLLFGLIRWRSGPGTDDGGLMRPAFPGPGWPAQWQERERDDPWSDVVVPEAVQVGGSR